MDISTLEELDRVAANLHDCPFDLDRMNVNETNGIWAGIFLRPLWEDSRAEHRGLPLLYARTRLPVVEATLTIEPVDNVEIIDEQGIGLYTFNDVEKSTRGLRLRFNERMQILLRTSQAIKGTYKEQPLPGYWAVYHQLLLLQSGPKIETGV